MSICLFFYSPSEVEKKTALVHKSIWYGSRTYHIRAGEPMACRISLAHSIHCCPNSYFFGTTSISIFWRICVHIHTSDFIETLCELPLLPNSTAGETFLHKSGVVWLGENVTLDKMFYSSLFKQEVVADQSHPHFHPYCIFWGGPYLIYNNNYTMDELYNCTIY